MTRTKADVHEAERQRVLPPIPTDAEWAHYGRLSWVLARLDGLTDRSCSEHDAHVECYELSASRHLLEEFLSVAGELGLLVHKRGHEGQGIQLTVGDRAVFLVPQRAGRREKAGGEDAFHLWPIVRGCPTNCLSLPSVGLYGLAVQDCPDTVDRSELELRWALQLVDGMQAKNAKSVAAQLLN